MVDKEVVQRALSALKPDKVVKPVGKKHQPTGPPPDRPKRDRRAPTAKDAASTAGQDTTPQDPKNKRKELPPGSEAVAVAAPAAKRTRKK